MNYNLLARISLLYSISLAAQAQYELHVSVNSTVSRNELQEQKQHFILIVWVSTSLTFFLNQDGPNPGKRTACGQEHFAQNLFSNAGMRIEMHLCFTLIYCVDKAPSQAAHQHSAGRYAAEWCQNAFSFFALARAHTHMH